MSERDKEKILKEALQLTRVGRYDKAIEELQKLLRLNPKDTRALQKIAELQSKKGDNQEAIKTYFRLAELYEKDGFIDFAISLYKTIINLDSGLFNVHLKLGELFLQKNLRSEALGSLQAAFKLCQDKKMVKEGIEVLKQMVIANPEDVSSIERLADHYYYDEGKSDAAKNLLHRAADILKRSSHIDKAQKLYERILNMDSKDELALRRLTEFNVEDGAVNQAVDIYERMLRYNPNDFKILKKAIEVYRGLGDIEKVKIYLRRLASAYKLKGEYADIKEVYKEILSLDPFDPEAIDYIKQGKNTKELEIQNPHEKQKELVIQKELVNVEEIEEFSSSDQYHSQVDKYGKNKDSNLENVLDEDNAKELEGSPTHFSDHQEISSQLTLVDSNISEMEVVDKTQLEEIKEGEAEVLGVLNNKGDNQEVEERREVTSELNGLSSARLNKIGESEFFELGMMHKDKMMFEQAASEFRKSIMEGYKVWESYMMIGICFLNSGDGKTALQWFQKGLFLDGLLVDQIIALKSGSAIALGILGNYSDAIKVLEGIVVEYGKYEMG